MIAVERIETPLESLPDPLFIGENRRGYRKAHRMRFFDQVGVYGVSIRMKEIDMSPCDLFQDFVRYVLVEYSCGQFRANLIEILEYFDVRGYR